MILQPVLSVCFYLFLYFLFFGTNVPTCCCCMEISATAGCQLNKKCLMKRVRLMLLDLRSCTTWSLVGNKHQWHRDHRTSVFSACSASCSWIKTWKVFQKETKCFLYLKCSAYNNKNRCGFTLCWWKHRLRAQTLILNCATALTNTDVDTWYFHTPHPRVRVITVEVCFLFFRK